VPFDEADVLARAAARGYRFVQDELHGKLVWTWDLANGTRIAYGERRLALSFMADHLRHAGAFERRSE
jgi:hypothetical protein